MKALRTTFLCAVIACVSCSLNGFAQEVHVTSEKGVTTLSVMAHAANVAGQRKTAVLTVTCRPKNKKMAHTITLLPGGILTEQEYSTFGGSASLVLQMTIGGQKQSTTWVSHEDLRSFDYVGKTEAERVHFLEALLSVPTVSIEYTPFLTGTPASSTFDLTGLQAEFPKHPECAMK
jgi:hypothetical protein